MDQLPADFFTASRAYTEHIYRDAYPAIDPTRPALSQTGKVILITGASAGIGAQGLAPAFARAQAKTIILAARDPSKLEATATALRQINPSIEILCVPTDITSPASIAALFATVRSKYTHVDVLVNNAGVVTTQGPLVDADPTKWWAAFELNLRGTFLVTQEYLRLLGAERQGTIVTINTGATTMVGMGGMSSYSISKLGSARLMEWVAAEHLNVSAVSLDPGIVWTDTGLEPFKRFALDTFELVGGAAVWLATDTARFLSARFVSANWSVDDLMKEREKIAKGRDMKFVLEGKYGPDRLKSHP